MKIRDLEHSEKNVESVLEHWKATWIQNMFRNYHITRMTHFKSMAYLPDAKTVLVLGSGPTLDNGFDRWAKVLKKMQANDKLVIIGSVQTLPTCARFGIYPDFVIVPDANPNLPERHLEWLSTHGPYISRLSYILPTTCDPAFLSTTNIQPNQVYLYNGLVQNVDGTGENDYNLLLRLAFPTTPWVWQGGNVVTEACLIYHRLFQLGISPSLKSILLLGADFSFPYDEERTRGEEPDKPRSLVKKDLIQFYREDEKLPLTNTQMFRYMRSMETVARACSDIGVELQMVEPVSEFTFPLSRGITDLTYDETKWAEWKDMRYELVNYKASSEFTDWKGYEVPLTPSDLTQVEGE